MDQNIGEYKKAAAVEAPSSGSIVGSAKANSTASASSNTTTMGNAAPERFLNAKNTTAQTTTSAHTTQAQTGRATKFSKNVENHIKQTTPFDRSP